MLQYVIWKYYHIEYSGSRPSEEPSAGDAGPVVEDAVHTDSVVQSDIPALLQSSDDESESSR